MLVRKESVSHLAPDVIQYIGKKPATATGGIENPGPIGAVGQIGLAARIHHLYHQPDDVRRGEELSALGLEHSRGDLLVGRALDVYIGL